MEVKLTEGLKPGEHVTSLDAEAVTIEMSPTECLAIMNVIDKTRCLPVGLLSDFELNAISELGAAMQVALHGG